MVRAGKGSATLELCSETWLQGASLLHSVLLLAPELCGATARTRVRYQGPCLSHFPSNELGNKVAGWNGRGQAACGPHSQHLPCAGFQSPQPPPGDLKADW